MALVFEAKVTGAPDKIEVAKMKFFVTRENNRRTEQNFFNRDNPDYTPIDLLPDSTNVDLKNSYEKLLVGALVEREKQMNEEFLNADVGTTKLKDIRDDWAAATESQRQAAIAALNS